MPDIFPNTFLCGVQKAGTTTLDDWLSQHPQIYCYDSLKDVHLFYRFKNRDEIINRLKLETPAYNNEPVVLQSAVNYIFYPSMMEAIASYKPDAKLIVILRNPMDRAVSAYHYFKKMRRETRNIKEALLYTPKDNFEFSHDNSDFTYIEHGLYHKQISDALKYFTKDQLLVLDYAQLARDPQSMLRKLYSFLGVDENFVPDLSPKNVTGEVKSDFVQNKMLSHNKYRKWIVDHLIDPIFPVNKRKQLKRRIFEMNTAKGKSPVPLTEETKKESDEIKRQLRSYFEEDTAKLDALLGTDFSRQWFAKKEAGV